MKEIRFHGRGGQGAVLAARMLATAFVVEGKYVATPRLISEYTRLIRKFRHLAGEELARLQEEVNSNFAFLRHLTEFGTSGTPETGG